MSIVLGGNRVEVPGVVTRCWLDDPGVRYVTDKNPRTRRIRGIVIHTHDGAVGDVLPGVGPNTTIDDALASYQVTTPMDVSWDFTIDLNGDVTWQNDPLKHYTWHAGPVNPVTLGFEFVQQVVRVNGTKRGNLFQKQIEVAVLMVGFLTDRLGIQRQTPWYAGKPDRRELSRLSSGGDDVVGVYGHRNITDNKTDPDDEVFESLADAGYELFDLESNEDLNTWKERQRTLGLTDCDGIPLTDTVAALESSTGQRLWTQAHSPA